VKRPINKKAWLQLCSIFELAAINGQYVSRGRRPRTRKGCRAHIRRKVVVRDDAVMAFTMSTYEEDEEAEFPGALLQGEHDRLQAGRVSGTSISKEDHTFGCRWNFVFCRLYPFSPKPPRQCLAPACDLSITLPNIVSRMLACLSI
jgi:hypothetical protein